MTENDHSSPLRSAIYTRKSTNENLDQDFNTLAAQREAGEAYAKTQGWTVLPHHYDDGGFTGGNMDRPALQRLLDDIDQGRVDCVVVYKVDRLSRSLLDFARMMEVFEEKGISFVSTTQQFNTATSIGRLTLHLLLSFAQFEREMISERTRDKLAAARRRGKWIGGRPVLGYEVDRVRRKLEILPEEAEQVKIIFDTYLQTQSITTVTEQVNALGWQKKRYQTKDGRSKGGGPFDRNTIHRILRNRLYTGQVVYKGEIHDGEHDVIIEPGTFEQVQALIDSKRCGRGPRRSRNFDYLLKGLLFCTCESTMTTVNGTGRNRTVYRYYRCYAQTRGQNSTCHHPRVPAEEIEPVIIEKVRTLCADTTVREQIAERLQSTKENALAALIQERSELRQVLSASEPSTQTEDLRRSAQTLDEQIERLNVAVRRVGRALDVLDNFTETWEVLIPEERCELVRLLIERIDVDIPKGTLQVTFHDLAEDLPSDSETTSHRMNTRRAS